MSYTPVPYTTAAEVKTILRVSNNKVIIGNDPGQLSSDDLDVFILQTSRFIDGFVRTVVLVDKVPIPDFSDKPEITYAAPYHAAYLVVRAMYGNYRDDKLGAGITGFLKDAMDALERFRKNVNEGVYPDLSPATGGTQFITAEQFFQTQIGVEEVDCHLRSDQQNIAPTKNTNIGPFSNGQI